MPLEPLTPSIPPRLPTSRELAKKKWIYRGVIFFEGLVCVGLLVFASAYVYRTFFPAAESLPLASTTGGDVLHGGPKLLVLGLDGAGWPIVERLIKEGKMPNLQKLIAEGVRATPPTLNPTISPMIWTTIATGREPWKHGVRNFVSLTDQSYSERLVGSDTRRGKALWNILSDAGLRVGVFSYWATWPPEDIRGYTVSDLALLDPENGISPDSLRDVMTRVSAKELGLSALFDWPDVNLPVPTGHNDAAFFKAAHDKFSIVERLFKVNSLALFDQEKPDALMQVDGMTDATQHLFTKFLYPGQFPVPIDPDLQGAYGGFIDEIFMSEDALIGEYIERAGPDTNIIVLSDHGFFLDPAAGDRFKGFNRILAELGYTKLLPDGSVDYAHSQAFECNNNNFDWQRRLCINVVGKYPQGIVSQTAFFPLREKIIAELQGLKTEQGTTLLASVVPEDGQESDVFYDIRRTILDEKLMLRGTPVPIRSYVDISVESGNHYSDPLGPNGIFVWKGPNIKQGVEVALNYVDIVPNILYALGLPIAEDMDGIFRPDIFVDPGTPKRIETYEDDNQSILGLLTIGTEADDRASFDGGHLEVVSRIEAEDGVDRFCFRPANPDQTIVSVDRIEHTSSSGLSESLVSFRALPFEELPERHGTHISLDRLQFQTIDKEKYSFVFPVGETEQPSLALWTNMFFGIPVARDGELYITAQGVPAGGVYPEIKVQQFGKEQIIQVKSSSAHIYHVPVQKGDVRVVYDNDGFSGSEDRNVLIQDVYVSPVLLPESVNAPQIFSEDDNVCIVNQTPGTTEISIQLIPERQAEAMQIDAQDEAVRLLNELGELSEQEK